MARAATTSKSDAPGVQTRDDLAQSEFVTIVGHQLRTPLSAVKWVMKMLLDGDVGELTREQKNLLWKGYQSNERMINLVNDMLNVALIESGRLAYRFTRHSLEEVLHRVLLDFVGPLQRKKISLALEISSPPRKDVRMDPDRIATALHNVIDNAIEYTPDGGSIRIGIRTDGQTIEIWVKDSGIGIPPAEQEKIFNRFFRGRKAVQMETDGSGVGLFIVKSIIEQHGGRIWFESQVDRGTTFHLLLPQT